MEAIWRVRFMPHSNEPLLSSLDLSFSLPASLIFFARSCQRPSSIIPSAAFSMAKQMIIHQQHIFILFCTVTLNVCPLFFFRVVSVLFAAFIVHVSICHVIAISTLVQVAHNQSSHINTDTHKHTGPLTQIVSVFWPTIAIIRSF